MAHGAHAAVAAMMEATKASGAIVRVEPDAFAQLVGRQDEPLVIRHYGGVFAKRWELLTAHRGFVFYTKTPQLPALPGRTEYIEAKQIWIPG
jgi:hypothetical protein